MTITVTEDHNGTLTTAEREATDVGLVLDELIQRLADSDEVGVRFGDEVLSGITLHFKVVPV